MDLIIKDDEGRILYGHQLITLIMASGNKSKVTLCDGIEAEAFSLSLTSRQNFQRIKTCRRFNEP